MKRISFYLLILVSMQLSAQDKTASSSAAMKTFVSGLMKKMTLDEKIGQLNLPGSGDIVTGQASNSDIAKKIKEAEALVESHQKKIQQIEALMAQPGNDPARMQQLGKDRTEAQNRLAITEENWMKLSEDYEAKMNA